MADILIAHNSNPYDPAHTFFDACYCRVRQLCVDYGLHYKSVTTEKLTEKEVMGAMPENHLCIVISHGDSYGIMNEEDEYYISTTTANYAFANKGLYAIACSCGQNMKEELMRIGLSLFIGYKDELRFLIDDQDFVDCAIEGVVALFRGKTLQEASEMMTHKYIDTIGKTDNFIKRILLEHNLNNLVTEGKPTITFCDLQ